MVYNDRANKYTYRRESRQSKTRKNKNNVAIKLQIFGIALFIMSISLTIVIRYAYITQTEIQLRKLDEEIQLLQKEKQELVITLESIKESQWIEKEAKERLGMIHPTREQTVYVSIEDKIDKNNIAANDKNNNSVFLKAFGDFFNKVVGLIE